MAAQERGQYQYSTAVVQKVDVSCVAGTGTGGGADSAQWTNGYNIGTAVQSTEHHFLFIYLLLHHLYNE